MKINELSEMDINDVVKLTRKFLYESYGLAIIQQREKEFVEAVETVLKNIEKFEKIYK